MKISPYTFPLVPAYKSKAFKKKTIRYKTKLEKIFFTNNQYIKKLQDYWTYYTPKHRRVKHKLDWMPKLYVCVGASEYWPTIERFVHKLKNSKIHWKFYMAPTGYERPDKIVFYFDSGSQLKRFVKTLRPLLPKKGFHPLGHTASTVDLKIEPKNRQGIYIGMDPPMIGQSWRVYRSHCIAWADLNKDYLDGMKGGREQWFKRMNLSLSHQGPYSLTPARKNVAFIQKYWKMING